MAGYARHCPLVGTARTAPVGVLMIFDAYSAGYRQAVPVSLPVGPPDCSAAIRLEEEDVRIYIGSSGIPQQPGSTEGTVLSSATQLRTRIVAVGGAIVFLLVAGVWIALTQASAQPKTAANPSHSKRVTELAAGPLQVTSVTPADHSANVSGLTPIRLQFSEPIASTSPLPTLRPGLAGTWHGVGSKSLEFVPAVGFKQSAHVTVTIPGGALGMRSTGGGLLGLTTRIRFRIGTYQTTRLDQLLAQLGYLPLTWTASPGASVPAGNDAAGQLAAAYDPPAGTFRWQPGYPSKLRHFWRGGSTAGLILKGAVMAFESNHGLTIDGIAGPEVWTALLKAEAADDTNKNGYTYAIASEASPETLTIWHNGRQVFHSLANTGIPQSPTTIGTAPVYLKYYFQIMKGKNPDGTKYADPVYYVSYFRSGEAVHYYPRASYGFPQSLGCVELPFAEAKVAWPYLTYGSLVTVLPGSQTPSTSPTDPTT
jgi:peptidoglycan hydrolase-like protein with peptidoglycan-binding domain